MIDRRKDTRRINDNQVKWITEQFQDLRAEFTNIKELFAQKFDNGVNKKFEDILGKLNSLPCDIQDLKLKTLKTDFDEKIRTSINNQQWLVGIIVGCICSIPSVIMIVLKIIEIMGKR